MSNRPLESLPPTETLELPSGLSLVPRIKLLLTVYRSDTSVAPIDDWQLKRSLIDYLKSTFSVTVPEDDLEVKRFKDLKKRKRGDPVGRGILFIRDLGFVSKSAGSRLGEFAAGDGGGAVKLLEKKLLEWRKSVVDKMDGIELNLVGVKFRLTVATLASDDFEGMRKEWEEHYAFGNRGYSRSGREQPDTIVLRGIPSRWFAEPRVSSKPSMLVTHTIFSALGKIRNLDVAEDDSIGNNDGNEEDANIVSGLHCKIVVRFEKYKDFYNALKVLSGRSLQKEGSRLRADYDVTWDKDGFFKNVRSQTDDRRWTPASEEENYRSGAPRYRSYTSRHSPDNARQKRFKAIINRAFKLYINLKSEAVKLKREEYRRLEGRSYGMRLSELMQAE